MKIGVLAAHYWTSNAYMVEDCVRLGYLREDWHTLDPTYGRGIWWKRFRPSSLVTNDLVPGRADHAFDFRHLPAEWANSFDAVAYDAPYVAIGGRKGSAMAELHDRFGLIGAPRTPALLQHMLSEGLTEMQRVAKPRAFILVKCQDYISSGKLFAGSHYTLTHGLDIGLEYFDRLERIQPNPRPQPTSNRRQVHARRNLSTLLVFRKARA